MRAATTRWTLALLFAAPLFGQYQYFFTDTFYQVIAADPSWSGATNYYYPGLAGGIILGEDYWGYWESAPLLFTGQLPSNGRYEIRSTLRSPANFPTGYIQYLAATHTGNVGSANTDGVYSYYSVEFLPNPGSTPSNCTGVVSVRRQDMLSDNVGGWFPSQTGLGGAQTACPDNTTIRTIYSGPPGGAAGNTIYITVLVNNQLVLRVSDANPLSGGVPGVAIDLNHVNPGINGLLPEVDLGPWDSINPNPVNPSTIGTTAYQNQVQIQWQPATDNANGSGIYGYSITRNGSPIVSYQPGTTFTDLTVQPAMTYTYPSKRSIFTRMSLRRLRSRSPRRQTL